MPLQLSHTALSLHPISTGDEKVLFSIYASTREKEMEQVRDWSTQQKEAFLFQQFTAQHSYYQQNYKGSFFWLIQKGQETIGRLYLSPLYTDGSIRIIDIALLPAYRNMGYGESILQDIQTMAAEMKQTITIHVESFNPAMRFYERLGFRVKDTKNGVYYLLEWKEPVSNPVMKA